jgi:hypothetical protein
LIRKLALASCIAIAIALPIPLWTAVRAEVSPGPGGREIGPKHLVVVWIAFLLSLILPLFYFSLFRHRTPVRISKGCRWLCAAGALSGVIVIVAGFRFMSLKTLLSEVATLSCIVLLVALLRGAGDGTSASGFLRSMTWVSAIGGGVWFLVNMSGLVLVPSEGGVRTLLEQICLFTAPVVIFASHGGRE